MTDDIMAAFRDHISTALITETVLAGIYALFAILMIAGVKSRVRCLMLPYLIYQGRNSICLLNIEVNCQSKGPLMTTIFRFDLET